MGEYYKVYISFLMKMNFLVSFSKTEVNIIQIIKMKRHQHHQVLMAVRLAVLKIIRCRQTHAIATMFKMFKKWPQPMLLHLRVRLALIQPVAIPPIRVVDPAVDLVARLTKPIHRT